MKCSVKIFFWKTSSNSRENIFGKAFLSKIPRTVTSSKLTTIRLGYLVIYVCTSYIYLLNINSFRHDCSENHIQSTGDETLFL